jgi:D-aminopeptidase
VVRIYLMTDMEGVAGILDHDDWCQPAERGYPGRYYDLGREFLTEEVNAAIDGFFAGGADEVVVSDGHGAGGIDPNLLDERAQMMRGWPSGWAFELDASYQGVAWVGQHAKAGTVGAHLAHTQWFNYLDQQINGISIGEFGEFLFCASELGVPAFFATGDEAFCREAAALVPGITTVAVKRGLTPDDGHDLDTKAYMRHNLGAIHCQPRAARRLVREGALAAMQRLREAPPGYGLVSLQPPYERITIFRHDEPGQPRTIDHAIHPSSVIGVLAMPFKPQPIKG